MTPCASLRPDDGDADGRVDLLFERLARWAESTDQLTDGERIALLRRLRQSKPPRQITRRRSNE